MHISLEDMQLSRMCVTQSAAWLQDAHVTYLMDELSSWESFAGQNGKNVRNFPVPYRLETIPARPFMPDAALTGI